MTDKQALRVYIGPVQGFISSGRRTRDFWAGSFLLSWLSGVAMKAVIDGDGTITVPVVRDAKGEYEPTLKAIMENTGDKGPLVGTLVNHFRAEVPVGFPISTIKTAVRAKFKELADQVFKVFIEPSIASAEFTGPKLAEVKKRWDAQTDGSYFEILAVMGDAPKWPEESQWLERRKLLRTHAPLMADANADRCPVHGELTELGGFSRQYQRVQQDDFSQVLRKVVGKRMYEKGGAGRTVWTTEQAAQLIAEVEAERAEPDSKFRDTLEIRQSERLSGMALVKRLFPLLHYNLIAKVIGWMPDHIYNIRTPSEIWLPEEAQFAMRNWPSTAFIAAIPWIVNVGNTDKNAAKTYAEAQYKTLGASPIWESEKPQRHRVEGIDGLRAAPDGLPKFAIIDGTLHFARGLGKDRYDDQIGTNALQDEFRNLVKDLRKPADNPKVKDGPASTHYAMLDMDGDGMGAVFSHSNERAERGSRALLKFSAKVPAVVRRHDGILIYAGADDVNAMLPIETAIPCAMAINALWTETIQSEFISTKDPCPTPTLSGSVVFADYQNALDDVRRLTHERLDKVAKDGMGRNALALAVMKSGGVVSEWASCWHGPDCRDTAQSLFEYARAAGEHTTIASRLPYLIRQRFGEVMAGCKTDGTDLFDDSQLADFLEKEMSDSILSGVGDTNREKAEKIVEVLRPCFRLQGSADVINAPRHVGGLLVARFLAKNCMWSYFDSWENRPGGTP